MKKTIIIIAVLAAAGVGAWLLYRNFSAKGKNDRYNEKYERGEVIGPVIPTEFL